MPQIKPYEVQTQVNSVPDVETPRIDQFGKAGEGMQRLSNAGFALGQLLQRQQEQKEISQIHADVSQAHADWTEELHSRMQDGSLDTAEFKQDVQDDLDKMGEQYSTRAGKNYFMQASSALKAHFIEQASVGESQLEGQEAKTNYLKSLNASSSALINDPSSFDMANKMQAQGIDTLVQSGGLPAKAADELKLHSQQELAKSAVRGWMKLNPDEAIDQLNQGKWDPYFDGDVKYQMLSEANQNKRANEAETARLQKQADEVAAQQQQKTQNDFLAKLDQGQLSSKDILNSNLDPFGSGSKEQFLNLLKTKTKESEEAKIKTDPYVMTELFNRIHAPDGDPKKITDENDLNAYFGKGLNMTDLRNLRNEVSDKGTVAGDANQLLKKNFVQMGYNTIAKPDPVTKLPDPQGAINYQMWLSDFLQKYQEGLKNGKTPAQLLSPKSTDYLGGNINSFVRTPDQIIKDMVKGRGAQMSPSPTPGGTPEPMVDVVSPQGQIGKLPASKLNDAKARGFKEVK